MQKVKKYIWVVLLLLLLIGSAGANWVLFSIAQNYYYDLQRARFNPLGLESYRDEPPEKGGVPRVVFFGDSRAFQWTAPETDQFEFINRGIGAQTSNQILLRYGAHVTPLEPDILVVQMCINELKTVPIFPTRRQQILGSCRQNTLKVIELAAETETTVILTTIFPVGEVSLQRRFVWSPEVAEVIDEMNTFIRAQESDSVIVFDTFASLVDESQQTNPAYAFDLLHLNPAGYAHLNIELLDILDRFVDNDR